MSTTLGLGHFLRLTVAAVAVLGAALVTPAVADPKLHLTAAATVTIAGDSVSVANAEEGLLDASQMVAPASLRRPGIELGMQKSSLQPERPARAKEISYAFAGVPKRGKAILVNLPSYELIAFEDGKPVLRSRVMIGAPATPTRIMRTRTSVVRYRPSWSPSRKAISQGVRPGRRPPGPDNPLGPLAIRTSPGINAYYYMHGTNEPELFDHDTPAFSRGCVRVEKLAELAAWVLDSDKKTVQGHMDGDRTFDQRTKGVYVIFGYHTEFPDHITGEMRKYADIYKRGRYAKR